MVKATLRQLPSIECGLGWLSPPCPLRRFDAHPLGQLLL